MIMKSFFLIASLFLTSPTLAVELDTPSPFQYETKCALETKEEFIEDTCLVVDTREKTGFLITRSIFSNRFSLTIKGRFDKEKGYMTWDSHNKYEYKWEYKVGGNDGLGVWTYVMPGFLLQNVSWD